MFGIDAMIKLATGKLMDFLEKNNNEKEFSLEEINKFLSDHHLKVLIAVNIAGKTLVKLKKTN